MNSNRITIRHPSSVGAATMRRAQELLSLCRAYYASRSQPGPTEDISGGWLLLRALDGDWRGVGDALARYGKHEPSDSYALFLGAMVVQLLMDLGAKLPARAQQRVLRSRTWDGRMRCASRSAMVLCGSAS